MPSDPSDPIPANPYAAPIPANPYAAPAAELPAPPSGPAPLRQQHLKAETNIRFIGLLDYVSATFTALAGLVPLFFSPHKTSRELSTAVATFAGVLIAALIVAATGEKLRELNRSARIVQTVWLVLASLGALGRLQIFAVILYVYGIFSLWSAPAGVVFGSEYREVVIPATSEVKEAPSGGTRALRVVAVLIIIFVGLADVGASLRAGAPSAD